MHEILIISINLIANFILINDDFWNDSNITFINGDNYSSSYQLGYIYETIQLSSNEHLHILAFYEARLNLKQENMYNLNQWIV